MLRPLLAYADDDPETLALRREGEPALALF
jgi:hypothetical protein